MKTHMIYYFNIDWSFFLLCCHHFSSPQPFLSFPAIIPLLSLSQPLLPLSCGGGVGIAAVAIAVAVSVVVGGVEIITQ
jgi:hypothetical protein